MMLFAAEVLKIPFGDAAFGRLPLAWFVRAQDYHADRLEAQIEAAEERAKEMERDMKRRKRRR